MGQPTLSENLPLNGRIDMGLSAGFEALAQDKGQGNYELSVLVGGVHCAVCIQKIESSLMALPEVQSARLNFSTRRLAIEWEGEPDAANNFVRVIKDLGYTVTPYDVRAEEQDAKTEERFLLLCLGVAGFALGNIMLLSVGVWSASSDTMGVATRDLMHWISACIALPTILFSGRPFFRSAFKALKAGQTNMDVPISLALILATAMSLFETFNHGAHIYFDSAVMLMFFLLIGRYLDFRARKNARSTASDLLSTLSGFATVIEGNTLRRVPIRDVREGMVLKVTAGEKFPVDGNVLTGDSEVDTSLVTGETLPKQVTADTKVYAGTLNLNAPLTVRVTKAAEDSLLADIVRLMEKAAQGQAKYVRLADRAARLYTPVIHSLAALAFLGWWGLGGASWQEALIISITVLIITCPCALGLAVPVVQVLASGRLMKKNILVKSGDALERLAGIDALMLDKTGTLTLGQLDLDGAQKEYDRSMLQLAASLAVHSAHPLSRALLKAYKGKVLDIENIVEHLGLGLEGMYNGQKIRLGRRSWCGNENAPLSGKTELWFERGGERIAFYFKDPLREDAPAIIEKFKSLGLKPYLVSGDREDVTRQIDREIKKARK